MYYGLSIGQFIGSARGRVITRFVVTNTTVWQKVYFLKITYLGARETSKYMRDNQLSFPDS